VNKGSGGSDPSVTCPLILAGALKAETAEAAVKEELSLARLVTGGSRGLDRNTVLGLAQRGVSSIFTYHSNQAEAHKVVAAAGEMGVQTFALQLDTGDVSAFDAFVQSVRSTLASLGAEGFDHLVNNAGISHHNAFDQTTEGALDRLYWVNAQRIGVSGGMGL
jgi:NAD(P)-dependent dehydrogenase (short-subunit alcohol dehydrogenase family)